MDLGGVADGLGLKGDTVSIGKHEGLSVGSASKTRTGKGDRVKRGLTYRTTFHRDHKLFTVTGHRVQLLYKIFWDLDQVSSLWLD